MCTVFQTQVNIAMVKKKYKHLSMVTKKEKVLNVSEILSNIWVTSGFWVWQHGDHG